MRRSVKLPARQEPGKEEGELIKIGRSSYRTGTVGTSGSRTGHQRSPGERHKETESEGSKTEDVDDVLTYPQGSGRSTPHEF